MLCYCGRACVVQLLLLAFRAAIPFVLLGSRRSLGIPPALHPQDLVFHPVIKSTD